ncbi:hypothetical protein ABZ801_35200 [Actinomadura sp. NPDC047616]|uniref:hypothetical protein n=1 Tax=Actinomadura sp. NPDC047616 TaxID=3155914 RepID=UPI003408AE21
MSARVWPSSSTPPAKTSPSIAALYDGYQFPSSTAAVPRGPVLTIDAAPFQPGHLLRAGHHRGRLLDLPGVPVRGHVMKPLIAVERCQRHRKGYPNPYSSAVSTPAGVSTREANPSTGPPPRVSSPASSWATDQGLSSSVVPGPFVPGPFVPGPFVPGPFLLGPFVPGSSGLGAGAVVSSGGDEVAVVDDVRGDPAGPVGPSGSAVRRAGPMISSHTSVFVTPTRMHTRSGPHLGSVTSKYLRT